MSERQLPPTCPNLLLICARAPIAGTTKTRLGAAIGMERAATLYRAFLTDLAQTFAPVVCRSRGFDIGWAFTPAEVDFAAVLSSLGFPSGNDTHFVAQHGDGWGPRQTNLLHWGHTNGYDRTIIVASDSPHLPVTTVGDAFDALESYDVVLGRVHDGGYFLLGVRGFHDVLSNVPMSTSGAADGLVARARELDLRLAEVEPMFDVDEIKDLERLRGALAPDGCAAPATWQTLSALGLGE